MKRFGKYSAAFAKKQGGVFEGRDMGTAVFPDAEYKIFLTARPEVRAERRLSELKEKRPEDAKNMTHDQMIQELIKRDEHDSNRILAPLCCPPDAYIIDTSELTLDEVVDRIIEYRKKKNTRSAWMHSSRALALPFYSFVSWIIGKIFYRLKVYGLEHYYPRGAILACNHTSYLDPPIVSVSWPEEVHFLARKTLFRQSWFGGLIRRMNTHPITGESGDVQVIKMITEFLENGQKVVLFPEGTRSENGELQAH